MRHEPPKKVRMYFLDNIKFDSMDEALDYADEAYPFFSSRALIKLVRVEELNVSHSQQEFGYGF
jgi:hypothetical protein